MGSPKRPKWGSTVTDTVAQPEDVLPFSGLSPETQQLVEQVQATKRPLLITRDGEAAAVLLGAHEYELLHRRLTLQQLILDGKRDIAEGRTHTQEEAEAFMEEWFRDDT
jgi:prevent-host-death family protein